MIDLHERLKDDVAAYALGTLDDEQARSRLDAHLSGCDECRQLLDEYRAVVDLLPGALPAAGPSPAVRERLLAQVEEEAAPRFIARPAAFAAALPPDLEDEPAIAAAAAPPAAEPVLQVAAAATPPRRGALERLADYAGRHRPALAGLAAAAVVVVAVGIGVSRRGGSSHKPTVQRAADKTVVSVPPAAPSVGVVPPAGGAFETFQFVGSGFAPFEMIAVSFRTPGGASVPWRGPGGGNLVTANANGRFAISFVPGAALTTSTIGAWQARFAGSSSGERDVSFTVQR